MYERPFHDRPLDPYTFLVTGGAGFIGSHIVEYLLKHGAGKVIVLDNLSTGSRENVDLFADDPRYEFIEGDIRNYDTVRRAVERADYVSHQAALGSVPRSINDPRTTNEVNISGFLNVLDAVRRSPRTKRMVYAASSSTYGDSRELPKREDRIGKPLSPYAITKYVNELYADIFGRLYDTDTIGLRYFNVFGPRQNPEGPYAAVIPLFILASLRDEPARVHGDGKQTRDFTFVENAVQANIRAFFAPDRAKGRVFNVAAGKRTSLLELLELLEKISGRPVKRVHTDPRPGDVRDSLADISKAERLLGYSDIIPMDEGLKLTYEWFKQKYGS
ncbi:MAG: SDR family oxidoreductase [Chlorobi bacterium]|nr:SDR family oxidoreductase [Chlorobiota bacterium]